MKTTATKSTRTAPDVGDMRPFRIKNILVPIDFSDCSKKALQYALPLAKEYQAAITLVYVVSQTYPSALAPAYGSIEYTAIDYTQLTQNLKESGAKELEKLAELEVSGEIAAKTVVRVGAPAEEIVETARSLLADIIVISTHGRTGLKHVLLGSVAEHVVQRAPCPVLVVREREHEILA